MAIADLAISGDLSHLAVVDDSNNIELVNLGTCEPSWSTSRELAEADADRVAVSNDAHYVASSGNDDQLSIWRVDQNRGIFQHRSPSGGLSIDLSPNDQWIAQAGDGVDLFEFPSGKFVRRFRDGQVRLVQFSPDARHLFRGTSDGVIRFADLELGTDRVWRGPAHGVFSVAFSEDGRTCVTTDASEKQRIRLWDTETGEQYGVFGNPVGSATGVAFDSGAEVFLFDNKLILCSVHLRHSKIAIWDLDDREGGQSSAGGEATESAGQDEMIMSEPR